MKMLESDDNDPSCLIAKYADKVLSLCTASLSDEYYYQSLPLCVIDSVYSIGVNYKSVQNVISRYCSYYGLPKIREDRRLIPAIKDQESISEFCEKARMVGVEIMADKIFNNRQRTSPRNGILKADAVYQFATVLREFGIKYLQDVPNAIGNDGLKRAIKNIQGQGSGLSWKYFLMLAGSDELVKPDRMVSRFLRSALNYSVSEDEAVPLVQEAAKKLKQIYPNLSPRLLDHEIWKYQRE